MKLLIILFFCFSSFSFCVCGGSFIAYSSVALLERITWNLAFKNYSINSSKNNIELIPIYLLNSPSSKWNIYNQYSSSHSLNGLSDKIVNFKSPGMYRKLKISNETCEFNYRFWFDHYQNKHNNNSYYQNLDLLYGISISPIKSVNFAKFVRLATIPIININYNNQLKEYKMKMIQVNKQPKDEYISNDNNYCYLYYSRLEYSDFHHLEKDFRPFKPLLVNLNANNTNQGKNHEKGDKVLEPNYSRYVQLYGPNSIINFHYIPDHSFIQQIRGYQQFEFYNPKFYMFFHFHSPLHTNLKYFSQIHAKYVNKNSYGNNSFIGIKRLKTMGLDKDKNNFYKAILAPGDTLYIPPYWIYTSKVKPNNTDLNNLANSLSFSSSVHSTSLESELSRDLIEKPLKYLKSNGVLDSKLKKLILDLYNELENLQLFEANLFSPLDIPPINYREINIKLLVSASIQLFINQLFGTIEHRKISLGLPHKSQLFQFIPNMCFCIDNPFVCCSDNPNQASSNYDFSFSPADSPHWFLYLILEQNFNHRMRDLTNNGENQEMKTKTKKPNSHSIDQIMYDESLNNYEREELLEKLDFESEKQRRDEYFNQSGFYKPKPLCSLSKNIFFLVNNAFYSSKYQKLGKQLKSIEKYFTPFINDLIDHWLMKCSISVRSIVLNEYIQRIITDYSSAGGGALIARFMNNCFLTGNRNVGPSPDILYKK